MPVQETEPVRRSVEVEYWVVDDAGRLTEPGPLVDATPGAEREFVVPLLEIKTSPCETTAELRAELFERIGAVLRVADDEGKSLVPLATPLADADIRDLPSDRTRIQSLAFGERFEYVRHCAGTHVHVEQQPGKAVDQFNAFVALDPALALLNSAPYGRGQRLAAGARSKLYRRMAYENVDNQGGLWPYLTDLADRDDRLEECYETFVAAAVDAGANRAAVESTFDPESAVWTPVKLREVFGTVEWRSPDTALPSEVVRLADDLATITARVRDADVRIGGATGQVTAESVELPSFDAVTEYVDAAIEYGLTSDVLRSYLDQMGFDVDAYDPTTHELDGRESISRQPAREVRLEYAERLEEDVQRAQSMNG